MSLGLDDALDRAWHDYCEEQDRHALAAEYQATGVCPICRGTDPYCVLCEGQGDEDWDNGGAP